MSRFNIVSTVFMALLFGSLILEGNLHFSSLWYITLVSVFMVFNIYGAIVLSARYYVPVKTGNDDRHDAIAITFDDGPVPEATEKVLDILKAHHVTAAFFCIGHRIQQHPELVRRMADEGHVIGNHSYTHSFWFDFKSASMMTKELAETDGVIQQITGKRPKLFRPPYGVTNPMLAKAVLRRNYAVIGWRVRSFDTVVKDPEKLLQRVTRSLKGGDVVLFHDHSTAMIKILPMFLEHVKTLGLKIVRVDELLKEKAYAS